MAASWLEECVERHAGCSKTNSMFAPRRVICVGDSNRNLHLTDKMPTGGLYAALSYCWGPTTGTLVTKRENIESHFKGISFDALPKVCYYRPLDIYG